LPPLKQDGRWTARDTQRLASDGNMRNYAAFAQA
jgi:hypothetical protein